MKGLIQRVSFANVLVGEEVIGSIKQGILLLLGIEKSDTKNQADRLLERVLTYRIFEDVNGKMNLSVRDIKGELLIIPQFTLVAYTKSGTRPGFSCGASPEHGKAMFDYFVGQAKQKDIQISTGRFGAYMEINLCNSGPTTFILEV